MPCHCPPGGSRKTGDMNRALHPVPNRDHHTGPRFKCPPPRAKSAAQSASHHAKQNFCSASSRSPSVCARLRVCVCVCVSRFFPRPTRHAPSLARRPHAISLSGKGVCASHEAKDKMAIAYGGATRRSGAASIGQQSIRTEGAVCGVLPPSPRLSHLRRQRPGKALAPPISNIQARAP
jgi:hypothetical protein